MKQSFFSFLALGGALSLTPVYAAETLFELYQLSRQHDVNYRLADAERDAAREAHAQARAALLPGASLSANAAQVWGKETNTSSAGYTLSLSQSLYQRDASIRLEQADVAIEKTDVDFTLAEQSLVLRVAQAYFDVLSAYDALAFARAKKNASFQQLEQSRQRFEVGLIPITDKEEAQAAYDADIANKLAAKNALDNAHEVLRELTGKYHRESLAALSAEIPLEAPKPENQSSTEADESQPINAWVKLALDNSLELKSLNYAVEIAQQGIDLARSAHSPQVAAVGSHSYSYRDSDSPMLDGDDRDLTLALQLSMPFDISGGIRASTREAQVRYTQALEQRDGKQREIERRVRNAYLSVMSGISLVKARQQAVKSSQTAYRAAVASFDAGIRTTVDVLTAQRNLLDAKRAHALSRYQYVLARLQLKQAAGLLDEDAVRELDQWFGRTVEETLAAEKERSDAALD